MRHGITRYARSIWLAVVLLTLAGILAGTRLPVGIFPHIDYPRVVIAVDAGDRDAEQMAVDITRPVEIALRAVPGVTRIRSTTSRGSAEVSLDFGWRADMVAKTLATQAALATLAPDLPPGSRFVVRRSDPTIFPVLGLSLTSASLDQHALRQLAELRIRPALTSVPGVAGVDILGGSPREFAVDVDPGKLRALGLSITDVSTALANANVVRAAGKLEDRHRLYLVLVESRMGALENIRATPVRAAVANDTGLVTLGQIATVSPAAEPFYTRVNADGQPAVLVNIRQALDGDALAIARAVDARLAATALPASVTVTPYYDQSELVSGAASAVRDAILIGAVLAGLVLFLFLRSWRLMLITGLMLPAVLAASCLLLFALGMTFNMMTLGGMAAAVGLVVDDAVVMLEHMARRLQEGVKASARDLLVAAGEMTKPLFGSTFATVIVFLPLAFISGVSGGFFAALAITMAAALIVSLLYARFVVPLLAAHWLRQKDVDAIERGAAMTSWIWRLYQRSSVHVLARPALFVAIVSIGLALLGYVAWTRVPSGFMPAMDEGGFVLDYKAQPGAAIADTDRLLAQVEQIVTATPEVTSYSRRTGVQLGGGLTEADEGDYFVRLSNGSRRPIDAVMSDIGAQIESRVPGLRVEFIQLMEDLIGDLTAVPQPIEVKLFGNDRATLVAAARQVGEAISKLQGVVEVVNGLRIAGDSIRVTVNSGAAAQQGLDPATIATQLEALVGGSTATSVRIGEQLVNVRVRGPADLRQRASAVENLPLTAPDGHSVRVAQVAQVGVIAGQQQLTREDLAPFIAVTARLAGRDLGSAMREIKKTVGTLNLSGSIRVDYGGLYAQQQQSFADLSLVFASALLLTALLLTLLFNNLIWTGAALATVISSSAAVIIGLWITGIELNISALMGLTMVIGMVTELIIFLLAELDPAGPLDATKLREAGEKRLRPIVMSALIAILTLSPLAFGVSRNAGLQQPLATAIIFGLIAAVPLVLFFLPASIDALTRYDRQPQTTPMSSASD
ncbi:MAG: efflux RND transporter permease subunit [Steroidobacteraceae bacterium]